MVPELNFQRNDPSSCGVEIVYERDDRRVWESKYIAKTSTSSFCGCTQQENLTNLIFMLMEFSIPGCTKFHSRDLPWCLNSPETDHYANLRNIPS